MWETHRRLRVTMGDLRSLKGLWEASAAGWPPEQSWFGSVEVSSRQAGCLRYSPECDLPTCASLQWLETILQRSPKTPGLPVPTIHFLDSLGIWSHTLKPRGCRPQDQVTQCSEGGGLEGPVTRGLRNLLSQGWGKNPN